MFELLPGYNATPMSKLTMQLPTYGHGSAYAPDFNGDGILDLFHHNHFGFSKKTSSWSDPSTAAVGPRKGGCMVDWDAVLGTKNGTYYAANDGNGFIERNDEKPGKCFDSHSPAFLDIDGDGIKDFYLVTGGGSGTADTQGKDNALFWGQKDPKSELGYRFVGGRDAAIAAGINGRDENGNERGRHHYWFDADGDNRLDMVTLNDERADNKVAPGKFYRNKSGRKFQASPTNGRNFAEFARVAVLTDVDGDGYAQELVVPSNCKIGDAASDNAVCKRSPRLSLAVYRFDRKLGNLRRQSLTQRPPRNAGEFDYAKGIATGDFDLDGKPDVAILWGKRVDFYLSSSKERRCNRMKTAEKRKQCLLFMGNPSVNLDMTPLCGAKGASGIRLADFNLDGRIDMLVVCATPGRHGIYELVSSKTWSLLKTPQGKLTSYGDLNSLAYGFGPKNFCEGVPTTEVDVRKNSKCTKFLTLKKCKSLQYLLQFGVCSLHEQNRVINFAPTVVDLDNDGYVDIILGYLYGSMVIFRNKLGDGGKRNKFLAIQVDKQAGPAASIGAILQLTVLDPKKKETTTQLRVVSTLSHETDSEGGAEDRVIFGLGAAGKPTKLVVRWPHCCNPTVVGGSKLSSWVNSMESPYEVPAPAKNCDKSCFK